MNRRRFLQFLGLGAASTITAAAVQATGLDLPADFDVERALWTPGAKSIFIPEPKPVEIPAFIIEPHDIDALRYTVTAGRDGWRYRFQNGKGDQMFDENWRLLGVTDANGKPRQVTQQDLHDAQAMLLSRGATRPTGARRYLLQTRHELEKAKERTRWGVTLE